MGGDQAMIAGIGCRRECPAEDIVALVRAAEQAGGAKVTALAAPAAKANEAGLHAAAASLGVAVLFVEQDALVAAQAQCVTRSACAERTLGVASVAEGCALAAAGEGGRLVLARMSSARATCALAAPALTLPSLRDGPLPLPQAGEGRFESNVLSSPLPLVGLGCEADQRAERSEAGEGSR